MTDALNIPMWGAVLVVIYSVLVGFLLGLAAASPPRRLQR